MTRVRNNAFRESRETVIDCNELNQALDKANAIKYEYFRLRALAVLSLLRLSGKRRTEISWIPLENFKVEEDLLNVTFSLERRGESIILQKMWFMHLSGHHCLYVQTSQIAQGFSPLRPVNAKRFAILRVSKLSRSNPQVLVAIRQVRVRELLHNSRQTLERQGSLQNSEGHK